MHHFFILQACGTDSLRHNTTAATPPNGYYYKQIIMGYGNKSTLQTRRMVNGTGFLNACLALPQTGLRAFVAKKYPQKKQQQPLLLTRKTFSR